MNQLITYNNLNDETGSRRYTGFPLNSTLVSTYTPDTIRSIITHAAVGKPYTTAVWIRINQVGIQISAQDPQIARTRIPVFIPIALVHDIFMQPSVTNVICIVYDEVKSKMKGVLLYVVHPTDAHLLRDDFRIVKQSTYCNKAGDIQAPADTQSTDNNRLFSPTSQPSSDSHRTGKNNRQQSPRRVLYVRNSETGANREISNSSAAPPLPQSGYVPYKGGYHSGRDDSRHRRHKSPRKNKSSHSASKTGSDNGSKHRRKHRSRSPPLPVKTTNEEPTHEQENQQTTEQKQEQEQQLLVQQQQIAAWQAVQQRPIIPMGIYNRYVPKAIPLPADEPVKATTNGQPTTHVGQQDGNTNEITRSSSHSRSISPKRQDQKPRNRPSSAQNAEASAIIVQSSHHHQHRRHHHSSTKPDSTMYNTISHSSRPRAKYAPSTNNNNNNNNSDNENETKQYLKQLIDDMQIMKLEMNKIRLASSSQGATRGRSDSLRVNLKELRSDIDAIRTRMAMTPRNLIA